MRSLPLVVSLATAALVVPALVRALRREGYVLSNYRGLPVAFPAGIAIVAAALLALVPLAPLEALAGGEVFATGAGQAITYVVGVALLGLVDDVFGGPREGSPDASASRAAAPPRGVRGHARAAAGAHLSTGALKAAGSLGLALYVLSGRGLDAGEYALATGVLVLATHFLNLLDLRPGRSIKALLLLGAGLTLGTLDLEPLWALGLFLAPILVLLPLELREVGMLGDTGSSAVGAVAGLWIVLALPALGQAVALGLLVLATAYGEYRSISRAVERLPLVRHLDSLGRVRSDA